MTAADVQLEHAVELEVTMNGKKTTLISAVEQKINTVILLTPIRSNDKVVGFPPDCMVSLLYIEDGHVFCWRNVQIKTVRFEGKIFHSVELVSDAEMLNRRGSYRVYIGAQTKLTAFSAEGPKNFDVILKDISESGMAFLSKEDFDVGRTIRLYLPIHQEHVLTLSAHIVRVQEFENRQDKLYGCKFIEKNKRLIGYLMGLQQTRQKQKMGKK